MLFRISSFGKTGLNCLSKKNQTQAQVDRILELARKRWPDLRLAGDNLGAKRYTAYSIGMIYILVQPEEAEDDY